MKRRGLMACGLVGVLAFGAAACGGDDDDTTATTTEATTPATTADSTAGTATSGSTAGGVSAADATEEDYLAALQRSLTTGAATQLSITPDEADCVAPKWLDTIGVDRIKENDISPDMIGDDIDDDGSALSDLGLSTDEGEALYDSFGDCDVDVREQFLTLMTTSLNEEATACVEDAIDEDLLKELMVTSLTQGDEALNANTELEEKFTSALAPCEELATAG